MQIYRRETIRVLICQMVFMVQLTSQATEPTGQQKWDGWSTWGDWARCSQRCGQGLAVRTRRCETASSTTTNHIGNCKGSYKQYKVCQGEDCIEGRENYRREQCAKYNHRKYLGKQYDWIPFINPNNQCELSCQANGHKFYAKFAPMVPDGLSCTLGFEEGACVSGKCQRVGCDGIVGSTARKDHCGVCKGDNSTCRIISGIFMRPHLRYGYRTISKIPAGSCSINITETKKSHNYLALKMSSGGYIFNGNFRQSSSGLYRSAGTTFTYSRSPNHLCPSQCIFGSGPTNRTIDLQLLALGRNPGIHYSFTVPLDMVDKVMSEMLSVSTDSPLTSKPHKHPSTTHHRHRHHRNRGHNQSHTPLQLQQRPAPVRLSDENTRYKSPSSVAQALQLSGSPAQSIPALSNKQLEHNAYRNRHRNRYQPRTAYSHPHISRNSRYQAGQRHIIPRNRLGNSQVTYSKGRPSVIRQKPSVSFTRGTAARQPPASPRRLSYGQQPRYIPPYDPQQQQRISYRYDDGGLNARAYNPPQYIPPQTGGRQALGSSSHNSIPDGNRVSPTESNRGDGSLRTGGNAASGLHVEYTWRIAGFTECSASCAAGTQTTRVVCMKGKSEVVVTDNNCDESTKPPSNSIACNEQPCPPEWFTGDWGVCSATCGDGTQSRLVECRKKISASISVSVSADLCLGQTRPVSYSQCNYKPCSSWKIGQWSKCSAECGLGQRTREITCVDSSEGRLPPSHCQDVKPPAEEVCDMGSCAKDWFYTRWSKQCSSECGEGFHIRKVFCSADDGSNLPERKCPSHKPKSKKHCKHKRPCGGHWFTGQWTGCSSTCGIAMRRRDVICMKRISSTLLNPVDEVNCVKEEKPVSEEQCADLGPCPPEWFVTDWTECSASCGTGIRNRELKCLYPSLKPSQNCEEKNKPSTRQSCNKHSCHSQPIGTDTGCKDKYASFCVMVVQARLCSYDYYQQRCCRSCRNHS